MKARPGDQVVIKGHHTGQPDRCGEVIEARGPDGSSPFMVRWDDTGHTTLLYPGTDCEIRDLDARAASTGGTS